jgi:hypothetical protein
LDSKNYCKDLRNWCNNSPIKFPCLQINLFVSRRGDSYANTLRRLVTDSIGYIEDQLENILQKVGLEIDEGKKEAIYNKYLRLWTMMVSIHNKAITHTF